MSVGRAAGDPGGGRAVKKAVKKSAKKAVKKSARGVTPDAVAEMALALPGVTRGTYYGFPAYMHGKKPIARVRPEDGVLVVHIGSFTDRDLLIAAHPRVFFTTAHYQDYAIVLVHLDQANARQLRDLLADAHTRLAAKPAKRARRAS